MYIFVSCEREKDIIMSDETFLIFIGVCKDKGCLVDVNHLSNVLQQVPNHIQMSSIGKPIVTVANNNPGLEGYLPLDTSNITLSTYTNNNRIVGCIHSCKHFDTDIIMTYIQKEFNCTMLSVKQIKEHDLSLCVKL